MPLTHHRSFRVRYYECDAFGHLNNVNYVRFMQEAAFDASAAAGFDLAKYDEMNRLWLVHRTQVEFLRPVRFGDQVEVRTWVQDFRHSSSRRNYAFTLLSGGSPGALTEVRVAEAHTDWVFVDRQTKRPVPIPIEMRQAFFPEGIPASFPVREAFPHLPSHPKQVFRSQRRVEWQDVDTAGIVNNPCYLDYIAECGFQAIAAFKWPWERMVATGYAILIRKIQVQYLQPARYGDMLTISTWVSNVRRVSAIRHYEIHRSSDGALIVQAHTLGVWVDLKSGMPIRIPQDMLVDFSENISSDEKEAQPG